jgi:uncharacterized protein YbjT (DUF2867 family)
MVTGVIGGTGMVGSEVVRLLAADSGNEVRVLTRTPPRKMGSNVTHHPIDLSTGAGLKEGLADLDVLIDTGNPRKAPQETLVEGTRTLLELCKDASIEHYVGISIIGCETSGIGYYKAKAAQEEVIRASPIGWSLLRATQFHQLIDTLFTSTARFRISPRATFPLQPVEAGEAAKVLVGMANAGAINADVDLVGPEIRSLSEFGKTWREHHHRRAIPVKVPLFGRSGKALKNGDLTIPGKTGPGPTFEQWINP